MKLLKKNWPASILIFLLILLILVPGCSKELPPPNEYKLTCYAASYGNGIYKSDNGGTSWFPLDADQKPIYSYYKKLYLSPLDKNTLYVTTTGAGLFTLGLHTGLLERVEQFKEENVTSVAFTDIVSTKPNNMSILVGMNGNGILKASMPAGSWQPCNNNLTYRNINVLFASDNALYAGTRKDLFRWNETSREWRATSNGIKNKNILSVSAEGNTMYAGSGVYEEPKGRFEHIPCLYKSVDSGRTWKGSDKGIADGALIYTIAINHKRPERVYTGTSDGIYRSIDGGEHWSKMTAGLPDSFMVFEIKVERMPDGKDVVYAASSSGIFMAVDDEETMWASKSYGLEPTAITSIVLVPEGVRNSKLN